MADPGPLTMRVFYIMCIIILSAIEVGMPTGALS